MLPIPSLPALYDDIGYWPHHTISSFARQGLTSPNLYLRNSHHAHRNYNIGGKRLIES